MALPPRDQRHRSLRDRVRLLAELGGDYLRSEARWYTSSFWSSLVHLGLHTAEEIESVGFGTYWAENARDLMLRLCHRLIACSIAGMTSGSERQQVAAVGAPMAAEDAPVFDEGAPAVPSPVMARDFSRFSTWTVVGLSQMMSQAGVRTSLQKKSTKLVKYRSSGILLIMKYLVKISKKTRILELKRRHLKIIVLTSNTPYPSRKIWRIRVCTSLKNTKEQDPIRRLRKKYRLSLKNDMSPRDK
nr:hypothetical protein [Tanacetum cinerariifolium]